MEIAEALADFEAPFVVHRQVGMAVGDYDGPIDMTRAPTGEAYVILTSDGLREPGEPVPCWYTSRSLATDVWLGAAKHYAKTDGREGARNLYWLERPRFVRMEFVALDQAGALQDADLRDSLNIDVGYITCRLLVSHFRPDGTEDQ